jgi:hypothetical protein
LFHCRFARIRDFCMLPLRDCTEQPFLDFVPNSQGIDACELAIYARDEELAARGVASVRSKPKHAFVPIRVKSTAVIKRSSGANKTSSEAATEDKKSLRLAALARANLLKFQPLWPSQFMGLKHTNPAWHEAMLAEVGAAVCAVLDTSGTGPITITMVYSGRCSTVEKRVNGKPDCNARLPS